jgi:hypothetical protein
MGNDILIGVVNTVFKILPDVVSIILFVGLPGMIGQESPVQLRLILLIRLIGRQGLTGLLKIGYQVLVCRNFHGGRFCF